MKSQLLSVVCLLVFCEFALGQQELDLSQFKPIPIELKPVFHDDFSKIDLSNYVINKGKVAGNGYLTIDPGSAVTRKLGDSPWSRISLQFDTEESFLGKEPSELRIWLSFGGEATDCYLRFRPEDTETGGGSSSALSIDLVDTWEEAGKPMQEVMGEATEGVASVLADDVSAITIEYRYGLVSVFDSSNAGQDQPSQRTLIFRSAVFNSDIRLLATKIETSSSGIRLRKLNLEASDDRQRLAKDQQILIAKAKKMRSEATALDRQGKYREAIPLVENDIAIRKQFPMNQQAEISTGFNNLGTYYDYLNRNSIAETLLKKSLELGSATFGEFHPTMATTTNNLASNYRQMGDYKRAEHFYRKALGIWKRTIGENTELYSNGLNNLGVYFLALRDVRAGEPLLTRSMQIRKELFGENHFYYAQSLGNLAVLYSQTGDNSKSLALHGESIALTKKLLGENHPSYAHQIGQLAGRYQAVGEYEKSVEFRLKCLALTEKTLGKEHWKFSYNLAALSTSYAKLNKIDLSNESMTKAIEGAKLALGKKHRRYSEMLGIRAAQLRRLGRVADAQVLLEEALSIATGAYGDENEFGEANELAAGHLTGLGLNQRILGDFKSADELYKRSADIHRRTINRDSIVQSERQQKLYQADKRTLLDNRLSNALKGGINVRDVVESVWQWKGAVTLRQNAYRDVTSNPDLIPILNDLRIVSSQLSKMSSRAPMPPKDGAEESHFAAYKEERSAWEDGFARLSEEREQLEKKLGAGSEEFARLSQPLTVERLQTMLPENTAFVDFLEFRDGYWDPKEFVFQKERKFAAFVIPKVGQPQMIRLGSVASVANQIEAFRSLFTSENDERVDRAAGMAAAKQLRSELWEPVEKHLVGIKTVIFSPDTVLGTLPFAALPGKRANTFLLEDYRLSTLPMSNWLPRLIENENQNRNEGLLVLGDVDYEVELDGTDNSVDANLLASNPVQLPRTRGNNGAGWESLPGFRDEQASVRSMFAKQYGENAKVKTLSGKRASETLFLEDAGKYGTLHLVTHGYFEDPGVKSIGTRSSPTSNTGDEGNSTNFINQWMPGLLSGMVMAGANRQGSSSVLDDGILRASEIEAASLEGVDLVVLSACETGLGPVAGGEGLTGLQRSFQLAGARSVIASLWKVEDRATLELMRRFYSNLWDKKMSKVDSLREAQLWMLRHPNELAEMGVQGARTRGKPRKLNTKPGSKPVDSTTDRTDPYFWAAFQLSGDWR